MSTFYTKNIDVWACNPEFRPDKTKEILCDCWSEEEEACKPADSQMYRFLDAGGSDCCDGQTLRCQPDPFPNGPRDQIQCSEPLQCCDKFNAVWCGRWLLTSRCNAPLHLTNGVLTVFLGTELLSPVCSSATALGEWASINYFQQLTINKWRRERNE